MKTLQVDLGERTYPIVIGRGFLNNPENMLPHCVSDQVLIVSNDTVAALYLEGIKNLFPASMQCDAVILPDGECYKTIECWQVILDALIEQKHRRNTTIIALGGGVIGDTAGFAAASYQRGVNIIHIPTTLLAQVDSSVGGKTAVNHRLAKNMIGAFKQPKAVLIDFDFLKTLPKREFDAGLAEVVKYAFIYDEVFLQWLECNAHALLEREQQAVEYAIYHSCRIKSEIVAQDECERGVRAILNFGHTFAHALESATNYQHFLHGEAVLIGMCMAAQLSQCRGWLSAASCQRVEALLEQVMPARKVPSTLSAELIYQHMLNDKKKIKNSVPFVLLTKPGCAIIDDDVAVTQVLSVIAQYV